MVGTTIAINELAYKKLFDLKCELSKKKGRELSFSKTIELLCESFNMGKK
jgi:predicted CopG family antitoxin